MKEKRSDFNRGFGSLFCTFLCIIMVFSTVSLEAQTRGTITGRVTDSATGDFLPGANVLIRGTSFGAATNMRGEYRIFNVPLGTFTVVVSYIGYDDHTADVTVTASQRQVTHDVALSMGAVQADVIVVEGIREGQMKALSQQRTAPNIKNVVADEQMQRFPDLNTAEVLQRIPAVSVTRDQGEGRYVLVRGTEARLNAVAINGERIASPEGEERFVGLDAISAAQVSAIEVTKAITPDMDADVIGGAVNLVTRSAFDSEKPIFRISAGSGYGDLMGKPLYQGDFVFARRLGANQNIGLTVSGNYYQSNRGSDNTEMEWGDEDDVDDNELPWVLQDLQLRDYIVKRDRYGVTANLDYRPNDNNKFFLRGMFNRRDDLEQRRRFRIRPDKGDYIDATTITEAAMERELKDRLEKQTIYNVSMGGEHLIGNSTLDYTLSYSYAEESKPDETDPAFELNEDVDLTLDLSDRDTPKYTITNLPSGYEHDADNWEFDEVVYENKGNTDKDIMASINLKVPYLLGDNSGELKFGGKIHLKNKKRTNTTWEYGWEGDDDLLMSQFLADDEDMNFMDGAYRVGPSVDPDKFREFFQANKDGLFEGEINHEDTDAENYTADESVYAGYGMTTLNFGNLMLLGGVRMELTKIDYTGNEVLFDDEGDYDRTDEITNDDSYSHFLPMLHMRYRVTPRTNFRLAFTSGLSRPNYYDLVPYKIILTEDEEMVMGNPALKPTTAYGIDFMGEHYFQGIGIISGGFFYKSLDNIIYRSFLEQEGGLYDGYETEQPVNGENATLYGFEINWQQQFTSLPGFLSGFGIYANYSYTKSNANLADREDIDLPGQSGNVGNLALSYEKYGFSARFGINYHGKYIDAVGEDPEEDIYYDDRLQFDISASQQIVEGLQVYFEAINLSNKPLRYYMGSDDRPIQREFYSWWMHAGIKYSL